MTKKNSNKEGEIIPNRKGCNCLNCDANCKWIYESNQTNHNANNYKSKTHHVKGLNRVEIHRDLQHLSKYQSGGK